MFTRLAVVVVECDYTIKEVMQASAIIRSDLIYFLYFLLPNNTPVNAWNNNIINVSMYVGLKA